MAFLGGDCIQADYNHPTLGSGTLYFKANESGTVERGGFRNNDDDNQVTGDGQLILQKNRRRATFETPPVAWDMVDKDEQDKLCDLAESPVPANWTLTHVNSTIWGAKGWPVGDLPGDTNAATMTLKLAFEGKLKKLA